jgi:hypothetical protein
MLKVIIAATGLVIGAAGVNACEYNKTNTSAQSQVPAVTAQTPVQTPVPTTQDVAQADVAKPATDTKTN